VYALSPKSKTMTRRQIIKQISFLTGASVIGGEFFLSGCKSKDKKVTGLFSPADILFFDEFAETIIPKTSTPGAKDAEVGKFMASYSTDCYDELQLRIVNDGIEKINNESIDKYGKGFLQINAAQKQELLTEIDAEAKKYNETRKEQPPHYFTLMKQMVLLGFFTSKPGAMQVLRYVPVPGKYVGCIDHKKGETSWA
jgi:hypothetical protein